MRETKDIVIVDNGNEYKFRLTAMSAVKQEKWGIKAGVLLASAGLLDFDLNDGSLSLDGVFSSILKNGLSFVGKIDPDKASALVFELIYECAVRLNGNATLKVTEAELENTFEDLRSLITLQKEVFAINFRMYQGAVPSATPTSNPAESGTSKRGISVEPLHP